NFRAWVDRQPAAILEGHFNLPKTYLLGSADSGWRQRRGSTIYVSHKAEAGLELTKAWWWRGVHKQLGHAVVLGETYQKLWPAFVSKALWEDRLAFASIPDWSSHQDLSEIVGPPPRPIAMQREAPIQREQEYPEAWPFGEPFDPPRPPHSPFLSKLRGPFGALLLAGVVLFGSQTHAQGRKLHEEFP